jgi:hypothetical protein
MRAQTHDRLIGVVASGRAVDRGRIGRLPPSAVLALQRSVGNRNVCRLMGGQGPARLDDAPTAVWKLDRPPDMVGSTRDSTNPRPYRRRHVARHSTRETSTPRVYIARLEAFIAPARPGPPLLASGRRALQRYYSRSAAAAYARKWAMTDNPAYGRIEPNDCTNFVSQALLAGGWTMVGGTCDDRKDNNVWWFKPMDCWWVGGRPYPIEVKASFTWGGAQNLYWFMKESGRGAEISDPMGLEIGDVLQMDMGAGHYNAGRIGHSMIVTDKSATDLFLSYHEDHHLDEPLSAVRSRYPSARFYPWQPGGAPGDYELPRGDTRDA